VPCARKSCPFTSPDASCRSASPRCALAYAADGFSGGELEQVVVSALYVANAAGQQPSARHLLAEIRATSLSVVMAERVANCASGRQADGTCN
jgi:hypothetical protein